MAGSRLGDVSELLNPAPRRERDPEQAGGLELDEVAREESDDELLAQAREAMADGRRMRAEIIMDDPAYAGRRVTSRDRERARIEEEDHVPSEDEDSDGAETTVGPRSGSRVSASSREWSSARPGDGVEAAFFGEDPGAADVAQAVAERATRDAARATAVRNQRSLWDVVLEARIHMAPALAAAAKLPRGTQLAAARGFSSGVATALASAVAETRRASLDLVALGAELLARGGETSALGAGLELNEPELPAGPDSDALWAVLERQMDVVRPAVDAAIDRWQRKALLTGAQGAGANFKAFNQSVSAQVAALAGDLPRLVERSQARWAEVQPLGHLERVTAARDEEAEGLGLDEARDPETYEDAEFYSTLLKEFLEAAGGAANGYQRAPKKRKLVDRRASKGRRIRYNVNEKLVNFMAPEDATTGEMTEQLYRNLFGGGL